MFQYRIINTVVLNGGFYMHDLNQFISFLIESDNNLSPYLLWHRTFGHIAQDMMNYIDYIIC